MDEFFNIPDYYDAMVQGVAGDVEFYAAEAKRAKGPVLELGAGTGRTLIPMAEAGATVTGLDANAAMLDALRKKLLGKPKLAKKITLVEGDMRRFKLKGKFALVTAPFRAFLHNLTVEDQLATLGCVKTHLAPAGRFVFNVFDPSYAILLDGQAPLGGRMIRLTEFRHPKTGNRVIVWTARRESGFDSQIVSEDWIFEELGKGGRSVARDVRTLTLRYVFRYEMEHLLARAGFEVEALYGDFERGPYRHGGEQVWVVKRG